LAPHGIRFDFNQGACLVLPNRTEGKWRVRLRDLDTGNILFQSENEGAFVSSAKRFFVRFSVEVWELDEAGTPARVLDHKYDARDREVLIQFPVGALGDIPAWFSYAAGFGEVHGCRLTCATPIRRSASSPMRSWWSRAWPPWPARLVASVGFSTSRVSSAIPVLCCPAICGVTHDDDYREFDPRDLSTHGVPHKSCRD
jgi:hypothetical protein